MMIRTGTLKIRATATIKTLTSTRAPTRYAETISIRIVTGKTRHAGRALTAVNASGPASL